MGMIKLPDASIKHFDANYKDIFDTGSLAEGEWNKKVGEWGCSFTSAKHALAVNSNGAGILAILNVLKTFKGKKTIFLQSNTMYGVKTMSLTSGLDLVGYVDCTLDYLMPTYKQVFDFVEKMPNPSESVFLLTHIGGWVNPDIEKIAKLCKEKGISLIEDCAHSLGATLDNKHSGLFGDAGVYSLYATKAVPAGEGGLIITNDEELYTKVSKYSIYDRFDQQLDLGVNNRMSEVGALLCYSVLTETQSIIDNKYIIAQKYIDACNEFNWNYIHPSMNGQKSNLYKFIMLSDSENPDLEFKQILSRTSPVYDYALGNDEGNIQNRHICLPIWYKLEDEIVNKVVTELKR
jgi:perosamine synthetase